MHTIDNIVTAGATLDFRTTVPDYPASAGWTLKYRLAPRAAGGTAIDISATPSGDDYLVQVSKSTTQTWVPGFYTAVSWVEKGSELYPVGARVEVEILARPDNLAAGTDGRSSAQKALDAITAVLENRATIDQQEYAIAGRQLKRMTVADLILLQQRFESQVQKERDAEKQLAYAGFRPRMIGLRFSR